jgi:hypothetical protein
MTQEKKQEKDVTELEHFDIKITVESRDIETLIHASDGCDALEISGVVIRHLRIMGTEPKALILP